MNGNPKFPAHINSIKLSGDMNEHFWLTTSAWAMSHLAREQMAAGKFQLAWQTYQQTLKLFPGTEYPPTVGLVFLGLGQLAYEWNDLATASRYFENALYHFSTHIQGEYLLEAHLGLAMVKAANGNFAKAMQQLDKAPLHRDLEAYRVQIALQNHDFTIGTQWFDSFTLQDTTPIEILTYIKVLLARGEIDEALDLIETQLNWTNNPCLYRLKLMVLQAETYHIFGDTAQAIKVLTHLLATTESEGLIRLFLDAGQLLVDLLKGVLTTRYLVSTLYATKLLEAMTTAPEVFSEFAATPVQPSIDPLTERELEVLECLAAGYSNRDIAQMLFVSEGTVKTHIKSIYSKMNVHSRTQAAARARSLGFIQN